MGDFGVPIAIAIMVAVDYSIAETYTEVGIRNLFFVSYIYDYNVMFTLMEKTVLLSVDICLEAKRQQIVYIQTNYNCATFS